MTIQQTKTRRQHHELRALVFAISVWVLYRSPLLTMTGKMQKTGPTVYRPYPRRIVRLTICRCYCKGSTFSSVILRPGVLVRSGARTRDFPDGSPALYQLSQPVTVDNYILCLKGRRDGQLFGTLDSGWSGAGSGCDMFFGKIRNNSHYYSFKIFLRF